MVDYAEEDLERAIESAQNALSIRKAAIIWNVPFETLRRRLHGAESRKKAQESLQRLSKDQEGHLCNWIITQAALGLPPSHSQLREFASRIIAQGGDNQPLGKHWIEGFLLRNPEISLSKGKRIDSERINGAELRQSRNSFAFSSYQQSNRSSQPIDGIWANQAS